MDPGVPHVLSVAEILAPDTFSCNGSTRNFRNESYGSHVVY